MKDKKYTRRKSVKSERRYKRKRLKTRRISRKKIKMIEEQDLLDMKVPYP